MANHKGDQTMGVSNGLLEEPNGFERAARTVNPRVCSPVTIVNSREFTNRIKESLDVEETSVTEHVPTPGNLLPASREPVFVFLNDAYFDEG
jgi:hypothetical protein